MTICTGLLGQLGPVRELHRLWVDPRASTTNITLLAVQKRERLWSSNAWCISAAKSGGMPCYARLVDGVLTVATERTSRLPFRALLPVALELHLLLRFCSQYRPDNTPGSPYGMYLPTVSAF